MTVRYTLGVFVVGCALLAGVVLLLPELLTDYLFFSFVGISTESVAIVLEDLQLWLGVLLVIAGWAGWVLVKRHLAPKPEVVPR